MTEDLFEDLFHQSAFQAYLEIWAESGTWPPDCELTRRRAYDLYEQELAKKNRGRVASRAEKPNRESLNTELDRGPGTSSNPTNLERSARRRLSA